jgi:hypothetical protein
VLVVGVAVWVAVALAVGVAVAVAPCMYAGSAPNPSCTLLN